MEEKLIKYLSFFQLSDLIGFAAILQVKEKEDFNEFIVEIIEAFQKKNRTIRKELLKLARDVSLGNKEIKKGKLKKEEEVKLEKKEEIKLNNNKEVRLNNNKEVRLNG